MTGLLARLALAGAAALLVAAALAPPSPEKYTPGNVIIGFEGGVVSEDVGSVALALAQAHLLPVKPHIVAPGDTVCGVLAMGGFPQQCSITMLQALDVLNPRRRLSRRSLVIGNTIMVPDVSMRRYRSVKTFAKAVPAEQVRSEAIKGNWKTLSPSVNAAQSTSRFEKVEFDAFEMVLAAGTLERQQRIMALLEPKQSRNLRVDRIGFAAIPVKAYQLSSTEYGQGCGGGDARRPPKINYRSYADVDGDLAALVADRPPGAVPAKVYIIDVAIDAGPNLADATGGATPASPGQWNCTWTPTSLSSQHATHMAGIIASRDNGFGFVGLSPTSRIVSFEFLQVDSATGALLMPQAKPFLLARAIDENRYDAEPGVYLVATDFPPFEQGVDLAGQLQGVGVRFNGRPIERALEQIQPLVVVAAGQASTRENAPPIGLSPTVPRSPQNLGDRRYVLVVTACDNCSRKAPTILGTANFGSDNGRYVHVAAPGGQPIVGWVSRSTIGAAAGTSQAAAYTAGILAEMRGRWPTTYKDPDMVKKRIQVTSWPIYNRPGLPSDAWTKLATGLVDPLLALVDPKQHWIKRSGSWQAIRLRGISGDFISIDGTAKVPLTEKTVARIVKVSGDSTSPLWVIYRDAEELGEPGAQLGEVKRDGPLMPDDNAMLAPCDGPSIPLRDIADLVIASRGFGATPC